MIEVNMSGGGGKESALEYGWDKMYKQSAEFFAVARKAVIGFFMMVWRCLLLVPCAVASAFGNKSLGKKLLVGIDIGASAIKFVELEKTGGKLRLKNYAIEPVPPDMFVDGAVMDMAVFTGALRQMVQKHGLNGRRCAISISGHSVIMKRISLPEMTLAELRSSITWEAGQHIPWDMKEVMIDVAIQDPNAGHGMMDVLLIAARKDCVEDLQKAACDVGLKPIIIDIATLAMLNSCAVIARSGMTTAVIEIGASMMLLAIIDGRRLVFSREISMGTMLVVEELQRNLNLPYEQAEQLLIEHCLGRAASQAAEIQKHVDRVINVLTAEIQRAIEFHAAINQAEGIKKRVENVMLCGGGYWLPGLPSELASRINATVRSFDPFALLDEKPFISPHDQARLGVAVGLALRKG